MLRKTVKGVFLLLLVLGVIWIFMRVVAEPLIRDINHSKRRAREINGQLADLDKSSRNVSELTTLERRRLKVSRTLLRTRLNHRGTEAREWARLEKELRVLAGKRGIRTVALEVAGVTPEEKNQLNLPMDGAVMRRISMRLGGPGRRWGSFLLAVSRLREYLTLTVVNHKPGKSPELHVDWIWHQVPLGKPLPKIRPELLNPASQQLDRSIPPLKPAKISGVGAR